MRMGKNLEKTKLWKVGWSEAGIGKERHKCRGCKKMCKGKA